ncbi:M20 family metallo-hydrolase [Paraburkholderia silvatlantica]|uniref:N-carbamoyl-L-amino-acid hydrolase n=1 Tax=Paraburkholderia silvatlantica TaxID=321895 RepID=A0A2U1A8C5_9BURK|nr:M20 family metallo-hydrolase [Paraburkholderia silvatlantica]MBB2929027.1 N-carbamoyl-L-amino-acid hydrolase [Paraburkholderia silvatlantica]PVY29122.1 N-carbamoyl-L-amino-acid hydrolase [Paraburkholderia silvatlantica]PXW36597.1 N-carbamoyl-L-amino-acid hydrolase [Paraburkholderia silvatlantica]PYE22081.1 N-carbamoyl-L-amino-acid hydrolase [Paraburkholderia silvatlantica]TDQ98985.1 N-carbamoyl-L-amino-acid hydrolase [Paraburkholderia silvatlantica]
MNAPHELANRIAQHVDAGRLLASVETLASFGARDDGGVNRPALSADDLDARRYLIERARALGCTVTVDACANLFIRRAGTEALAPVVTGSHIDTQPSGGKLDGCYGVLAGFEVLEALNDANAQTRRPLEVAIWTNEEGTRFAPGAMGSSAFVEPARMMRYLDARDAQGVTLREALEAHGKAFPELAARDTGANDEAAHAFVELHIEQGPQLESADLPLAVVSGIQGVRWYAFHCTGVAAHAGTTPMPLRRDAMTLALALHAELDDIARRLGTQHTRVTFGRWNVEPNSINTIPSNVSFTVDFRHPDAAVLDAFDDAARALAKRHDARLEALFSHAPVAFDAAVLATLDDACRALDAPAARLTSGAFHDAMYLAGHCPSAMLFVPSIGGISHNPVEATHPHHLVLGARALAHSLTTLCNA